MSKILQNLAVGVGGLGALYYGQVNITYLCKFSVHSVSKRNAGQSLLAAVKNSLILTYD